MVVSIDPAKANEDQRNLFSFMFPTIYELLCGSLAITVQRRKDSKAKESFRWIHRPADNLLWVELLLTKNHTDHGDEELAAFKEASRSFKHQHRGRAGYGKYTKALCQRLTTQRRSNYDTESMTSVRDLSLKKLDKRFTSIEASSVTSSNRPQCGEKSQSKHQPERISPQRP